MGSHALLQGIFLTQGWNSSLLHWQVGSLPLSTWEATEASWEPAKLQVKAEAIYRPKRWGGGNPVISSNIRPHLFAYLQYK